jgi:hypothetical protein
MVSERHLNNAYAAFLSTEHFLSAIGITANGFWVLTEKEPMIHMSVNWTTVKMFLSVSWTRCFGFLLSTEPEPKIPECQPIVPYCQLEPKSMVPEGQLNHILRFLSVSWTTAVWFRIVNLTNKWFLLKPGESTNHSFEY